MRRRALHQPVGASPDQEAMPVLDQLDYPGTSGRVVLHPDPLLTEALAACLSGWTPQQTRLQMRHRRQESNILAAITPAHGGLYHLKSRYVDEISTDLPLASAVCALIADLSLDWSETAQGFIGLHGGAVELGGKLLLLTGKAKAGKSTLITRLALEKNVTFFCDDVLPVKPNGIGISLGIAPRLRLPVPAGSQPLKRLTEASLILADDRYAYVRVPNQAQHGTTALLGGIILLDRREGKTARLHHLDPAEALTTLLRQSITNFPSADDAYAHARTLTMTRPCLRLVYSDLEDATALIVKTFSDTNSAPKILPSLPPTAIDVETTVSPAPKDKLFRRMQSLRLRRHGNAAFLWQPGETMIWQLNSVALAVWLMLEIPSSASEMAEAMDGMFPETTFTRLMRDIAQLLAQLEASGLAEPA